MKKLSTWAVILVLVTGLGIFASRTIAQSESRAEQQGERAADQMAAQNAQHEPHMAAALGHLRQAEEELEKAAPNKGGHRERAMDLTKQAMSQVEEGIQYYNQHVSPLSGERKK